MANAMHDRPAVIQAKSWTALPGEFRRPGASEHSINQKRGRPDSFLEGPIYVAELDLLFVTDIPYGRIFSIDSNTQWTLVLEYDGEPNGLVWNQITKAIVIADYKQGILELDPGSKSFGTWQHVITGNASRGRMIDISRDGVIYFTDQGMTGLQDPMGRVFRLYSDGRLEIGQSVAPIHPVAKAHTTQHSPESLQQIEPSHHDPRLRPFGDGPLETSILKLLRHRRT